MKKLVFAAAAALVISAAVPNPALAAASAFPDGYGTDGIPSFDEIIDEQYEASGAGKIYGALPDDVRYSLRRAGIDIKSGAYGQVPDVHVLLRSLSDALADSARAPLRTCCAVLAVIMISAMLCGLAEQHGSPSSSALETVTAAASCFLIAAPAAAHLSRCAGALGDIAAFSQAAIPVICSFILVARGTTGGSAALMSMAAGALGMAADSAVIELLRMYLALSCVAPVTGLLRLDRLLAVLEKNIKQALTLAATVFLGLLTVSSVSDSALDRVSFKVFKLVVSGSVPIIGGAVGDALGSLRSCVHILRASVGSFGILAAALILIPPIIETALWRFALDICAAAAAMFGTRRAEKLLTCCAGAMNVMLSLLVFTGVILLGTFACAAGGGGI